MNFLYIKHEANIVQMGDVKQVNPLTFLLTAFF